MASVFTWLALPTEFQELSTFVLWEQAMRQVCNEEWENSLFVKKGGKLGKGNKDFRKSTSIG